MQKTLCAWRSSVKNLNLGRRSIATVEWDTSSVLTSEAAEVVLGSQEPTKVLLLTGVPREYNRAAIENVFKTFNLKYVSMLYHKTGEPRGIAFATFQTTMDAQDAISAVPADISANFAIPHEAQGRRDRTHKKAIPKKSVAPSNAREKLSEGVLGDTDETERVFLLSQDDADQTDTSLQLKEKVETGPDGRLTLQLRDLEDTVSEKLVRGLGFSLRATSRPLENQKSLQEINNLVRGNRITHKHDKECA
mmetsp:Transcript_2210/g.6573  ORF Transcript_2210/g.6573 Transcript_2210/m.6573 type:complete len:249 (+) Transcript_2210:62-808(+)